MSGKYLCGVNHRHRFQLTWIAVAQVFLSLFLVSCVLDFQVHEPEVESLEPSPEGCGNGKADDGETCDDGNQVSGDGCSRMCQLEEGWKCTGKICAEICGDFRVVGFEGCDFGDKEPGDGCSEYCFVEKGWTCSKTGCEAEKCGDGIVAGSEDCDDKNDANGDGCSSACKVESGFNCAPTTVGDPTSQTLCNPK